VEPAPRQPRDKAGGSWQWARTAGTQRALLDAAREVFVAQGFADASIAEVVRRAGSSVGSLYHHFGGKSELFVALWQEYQASQAELAGKAVAQARRAGETDPFELFSAGARAFLKDNWQRRDLAVLFFNGDGPPGFEVLKRRRGQEWIVQNDTLLRLSDDSFDQLYVSILTSLIGEGARQVAATATQRQATKVIDATLQYVRRVMIDGPWKPLAAVRSSASRSARSLASPSAASKDAGQR
jgi:AcrR family transcriptional regulator